MRKINESGLGQTWRASRPGAAAVLWGLLLAAPTETFPAADTGAAIAGPSATETRVVTTIPPRPAGAITGTELGRRTAALPAIDRQRAAVAELLRGNLPGFLRTLVPVRLTRGGHRVVVWVMPDYLAIGSDRDFLRMPLSYVSATAVAEAFELVLPTTRIVDAVYEQAAHHLVPEPMTPGPRMRSMEYFLRHRELVERQLRGVDRGELVAGHKKDVVLSNRLADHRDRIAIYGWHRGNGDPIQPLSTIHGARYADYSHGVRLVDTTVLVDGEPCSIFDLLADPELSSLVSDEGPIRNVRELMHPRLGERRPPRTGSP